ncbi:MAG: threonine/serine exporter family protein [Muribaculaceae bacterium]|nr:threonine/serine exporter family protein [Muribaculaceae bacterium]MDE6522321.1 threonine/serine exporter family protein [Muribaculaceae bacterium]
MSNIDISSAQSEALPECEIGENASLKEICLFLSEYSAWLLGSGATSIRLEKNVRRMAEALGCHAEMTILPRHIHMTVFLTDHSDSYTYIIATHPMPISFNINTKLSRLSWSMADDKLTLKEVQEKFDEIIKTSPTNKYLVLFLASCANAAFCRLFTGDWAAVGVVFISTLIGFYIKQLLTQLKVDVRLVFIICAFISSVLASTATLFSFGHTPDIAVGTSVLYLVPGIPFLNSFSDMLNGHYICAFGRFVHAVVLTCCLSLGLCGGMLLMNLSMF